MAGGRRGSRFVGRERERERVAGRRWRCGREREEPKKYARVCGADGRGERGEGRKGGGEEAGRWRLRRLFGVR